MRETESTAVAERPFDEDLVPDRKCEHGLRFRTCPAAACVSARAGIIRKARKEARR